jgi:hypothetical protein
MKLILVFTGQPNVSISIFMNTVPRFMRTYDDGNIQDFLARDCVIDLRHVYIIDKMGRFEESTQKGGKYAQKILNLMFIKFTILAKFDQIRQKQPS